jgi:hypothetical protein
MNEKKAKKIRQQLRGIATDPREAEYEYTEDSIRRGSIFSLTIKLTDLCGRRVYKELKKLYAQVGN